MADENLLQQSLTGVRNGLNDAAKTSVGFAGNLLSGSQKLSDYGEAIATNTKLFGALNKTINGLIKFAEGSLEEYQTLSGIGASFGKEMADIKISAAQMGLTVEEMTEVLQNNMDSLSAFGGTTNDAIARFRDFSSGVLDSEVGSRLRRLGFTVTDINETLALYQEIAMQDGNMTRMSERQRQESAEELATELDRLSKLTGKQREQIADEMKERRRQGDVQAFLMGRTGEEQQAFMQNLAEIENTLGRDAADLFVDQAVRGAPTTEATRNAMLALGPAAEELALGAQAFSTGNLAEFDSNIQAATASAVDYLQTEDARTVAMLGDMNTVSGAYSDMYESMYGFMNRVEGAAGEGEQAGAALSRMNSNIEAEQRTQKLYQANNLLDQTIAMQETVRDFVVEVQRNTLDNLEDMATEAIHRVRESVPSSEEMAEYVGTGINRLLTPMEDMLFPQGVVDGDSFENAENRSGADFTADAIAEIGTATQQGVENGFVSSVNAINQETTSDGDATRNSISGVQQEIDQRIETSRQETLADIERLNTRLAEGVEPEIQETQAQLDNSQTTLENIENLQMARVRNAQSPFAGGFEDGGFIPEGNFGLVGEDGPEFISGPADIMNSQSSRSVMEFINNMASINRKSMFEPEDTNQTQTQTETDNISNTSELNELVKVLGGNFKDMNMLLNKMLNVENQIAETNRRQYKATKGLNGNLLKGIGV